MNGSTFAASLIFSAALISASVAGPALLQKADLSERRAECWAPGTQKVFRDLVIQTAAGQVKRLTRTQAQPPTLADIEGAMTVRVRDFFVAELDERASSAKCGATVDFVYKQSDGKLHQTLNSVVGFALYNSAHGAVVSVENAAVATKIVDAAELGDAAE